ncbi:AsnC family transcriptional regulator [Herminiimonas sp. CN]|uniref:siroheme decarboxylase subunit beta n=1 Tax=Herminiimonas sp. CN TaxID=1349818 RepID=UPI000687E615|nr:AsnC family transcriptional regulator [Herminiimonas sp. CN]
MISTTSTILAGSGLPAIDATDRAIIVATQGGLPLVARPYHAIAESLQLEPEQVMERMRRMQQVGVIRRLGVVPNHYAIGYRANGMSVWDVPDALVDQLGASVGSFEFVSHCYRRPRSLPHWPYNLFAMVHGKSRDEVEAQVAQIAAFLGENVRSHTILYSTRILKKTGLRLNRKDPQARATQKITG